jgi:hypothetical protein
MIVKIIEVDGTFDLIGRVRRCSFRRNPSGPVVVLERDGDKTEEHVIRVSAFVLNDEGKTIDQFHSSRN